MDAEVTIDVRDLEAPEPLQKVLPALNELKAGYYVRIVHRREGRCLRQLIGELGFEHAVHQREDDDYEIFAWRDSDTVAGLAANKALRR